MKYIRAFLLIVLASTLFCVLKAQERNEEGEDRFVRLMSAQSVRLLEINGKPFRQAEGPARFLHNNTWLICDTALWDVEGQIIHAMGHVSLEQDRTELTSDSLNYFVQRDVAEFRGVLVQLQDKDGNVLRTRDLDYNTKDSVAIFRNGAAMRDKDGQIMESLYGTYDAKIKKFRFNENVNMYTDSVFVKTTMLEYDANTSVATFPRSLNAWKDENMLSGDSGWWDRSRELFFFKGQVHATTATQEGWSDSLYFDRGHLNVDMLGNAQVTDTTRRVSSLAGRIFYCDSLRRVDLTLDPVVLAEMDEKDDEGLVHTDTVYFRADSLSYWKEKMCDIDSAFLVLSASRLEEISSDPVENIRQKAAEEAAKRIQEAIDNDPNADPELKTEYKEKMLQARKDSLAAAEIEARGVSTLDAYLHPAMSEADSLALADSLARVDSIARASVLPDTTEMGFLRAVGKVRMFRPSMQMICDSLVYSDVDSLARLFKDPVVWNDVKHQYDADSIYLAVTSQRVDKAYLFSNAFIHIEEEEGTYYDQIKSTEMTAYFNDEGQLRRFDALGGANALFFLREKERVSTANKKETTIMTADFEDGQISRISYFGDSKSDVYPVAQMHREDKYLKGYGWRPSDRPKDHSELTSRVPRASQRSYYYRRPRASFPQTERFFSGYMAKIYREIERSDSLRKVKCAIEPEDSLSVTDSLVLEVVEPMDMGTTDSLLMASVLALNLDDALILGPTPVIDSLMADAAARKAYADSVAAIKTPEQLAKEARQAERQRKKEEAKAKRDARIAARDARWEELDQRDALKQAAKDARKHEKRDRNAKAKMDAMLKEKAKEDALKDKYLQRYLKRYGKHIVNP